MESRVNDLVIETKMRLPRPPNYLRTERDTPIPVENMSDEFLRKVGERWTEQLLEHARSRRAAPPTQED